MNTGSEFYVRLGKSRGILSRQQIMTLRGQALAGDVAGAIKGLNRLLGGKCGYSKDRSSAAQPCRIQPAQRPETG